MSTESRATGARARQQERARVIADRLAAGWAPRALAIEYGLTPSRIRQIGYRAGLISTERPRWTGRSRPAVEQVAKPVVDRLFLVCPCGSRLLLGMRRSEGEWGPAFGDTERMEPWFREHSECLERAAEAQRKVAS